MNQCLKLLTFSLAIMLSWQLSAQCTYTLQKDDTFGDGWNGGQVQVTVAGVSTTYGLATGSTGSDPITASTGDTIILEWLGGSAFNGECSFTLFDPGGSVVYASGTGPFTGVHDTSIAACPSCLAPSALATTNITSTSADLGWTENGSATQWQIEYGPAGFAPGTGTSVFTSANPYNLTGLSSLTQYDFYVRAVCAPGDSSTWSGPETFSTLITPLSCSTGNPSFLFTEDFEAGGLPAGWTQTATGAPDWTQNTGQTGSTGTGPSGAQNGSGYLFLETSGGGLGDADTITTSSIDLTTASSPARLLFYYHMFGADMGSLDIEITTNGGTTWTNIFNVAGQQQTALGDPWTYTSVSLASYVGNMVMLRFIGTRGNGFTGDVSIDLVQIEACVSCAPPSNLMASNVMPTSADLGWTENGTAAQWQVEYGPAGFMVGTGTSNFTTTNPYSATGLMGNSSYDFYVRAVCGAGDTSAWVGPFNFQTPCSAFTAPWIDSVEAHTPTTALTTSQCWNTLSNSGYDWNIDGVGSTPSSGTGPNGAYSGSNYFYVEASSGATGDTAWLISPMVDINALTNASLQFYYHMVGAQMGDLYIEIYDGATWTTVDSIKGQQQAAQADPWLQRIINLTAFSGTVQARFVAISGGSFEGDISLDDIAFIDGPTCFDPTSLMATNITDNSADLGWTENGTATQWQIEYGPAGFMPGTGTTVFAGSNPFNISGLTALSQYDFYVRAVCSPGDTSNWSSSATFSTLITPLACSSGNPSYLFTEDFEAGGLPAGWTQTATGAPDWTQNTGQTGSTGTGPSGAQNGTGYLFLETSGGVAGDADTITTPSIDLSAAASPARLLFYYHMFGADMGALDVEITTDGGATWTNIFNVSGQQQTALNDPWTYANVSLSAYVGNMVMLRFIGTRGNDFTGDISIDLVQIESCAAPADIRITEIMYNPPESGADSLEFIEFYNNSSFTADLQGYTFTQGVVHTFGTTAIAPGGYYVIAGDSAGFHNVFGQAPDAVWASGALSNGGEDITLQDPFGVTIDSVDYSDSGAWPSSADGNGPSIVLCDWMVDQNDGANWSASMSPVGVTINGGAIMASPWASDSTCNYVPNDVAISAFVNLDSTYCNVTSITGQIVVTNNNSLDANNVVYMVTVDGNPVLMDSIPTLTGNSSDTITVGPVPVTPGTAGIIPVVAWTNLSTDIDNSNDTLMQTIAISSTTASATAANNVSCNGGMDGLAVASAVDGLGMYMYQWNTGANTDSIMMVTAGMYSVTITDSIGCTDSAMVTITEPAAIAITLDTAINASCNGNADGSINITVTGGTPTYTFAWSNGDNTEDIAGLAAGAYTGMITDANGCMDSATVTITEPAALVATATDNANGTAVATATGGTPAYNYQWGAGAANQTTQTATGLTNNSTYFVTITDANGCMANDSVTVTFVGLNSLANVSSLNMFPNPTKGNVFVELDLVEDAKVTIDVLNVAGQVVITEILGTINNQKVELPTATLPAGVYFVRTNIGEQQVTQKLIISRQ